MRNLPLGISDFSTIRNPSRNFIYIDKTAQIAEMVRMFPAVFIARPRRFGKSLLASTLRDLFGKGIEGFEGLDIAKTWTDTTYKVVSLDFSAFRNVGTLEDFYSRSICTFRDVCAPQESKPRLMCRASRFSAGRQRYCRCRTARSCCSSTNTMRRSPNVYICRNGSSSIAESSHPSLQEQSRSPGPSGSYASPVS